MLSRVIQRNMFYGAKGKIFETATLLRKNMTLAELVLWKRIRDRKVFRVKFRRQHPIDIYIVDFYCHEIKLAIEIDGEIHKDEQLKNYDQGRTADLNKYGVRLLRFSNDQVLFDIDSVLQRIMLEVRELGPL